MEVSESVFAYLDTVPSEERAHTCRLLAEAIAKTENAKGELKGFVNHFQAQMLERSKGGATRESRDPS